MKTKREKYFKNGASKIECVPSLDRLSKCGRTDTNLTLYYFLKLLK